MAYFPPTYSDNEGKILIAIYENPNMSYDKLCCAQHLYPDVPVSSKKFEAGFKEALKAIERPIVKGMVDGKQLKGGLGMYYTELKLRYKGKQAAIQERDKVAEFNKQLPKMMEEADPVAEEIRKSQEKE